MNREFILPDLGEGLVEATIVDWKVAVGDEVHIDQLVVEVESAKSIVELPVPYAGTVVSLGGAVGDTLNAGQVLLTVGVGADAQLESDVPAPAPAQATEPAERADGTGVNAGSGAVLIGYGTNDSEARLKRPEGGRFKRRSKCAEPVAESYETGASTASAANPANHATAAASPATASARVAAAPAASAGSAATANTATTGQLDESRNSPVMSPLVRREAKEAGFDARHLQGTGPNGLVLRDDVRAAIAQLQSDVPATAELAAQNAANFGDRRVPLSGMRAVTAKHMASSHAEVPKATIWLDVDVTPLIELRHSLQQATGEKFSITTLIARLVVAGLRKHPRLNSSFDGDAVIEHGRINLGLAAQTPRGLVVPVVHHTESMNLRQLRDAVGEVVAAAGEGKFPPERLRGGTFTLNNYGGFGVDGASPIINQPEAAMLGIGRIKDRPWAYRGEIALRKVATFSFVFDHRVCDGEAASQFLTFVTDRIEQPELLYADL
ncbi:dihydrolipoamide acetyltransferase family protein [Gulosibacter sediminis]|uniref:dihydrolipoamide acetyltransferase family protein n=1 Tax=Gulosibacter sediminis TaxID=1729695 RepID=UPI001B7D864E|nr:dihydrolipoamide acetyltransferase family protein [Gulosibacter sediminis]